MNIAVVGAGIFGSTAAIKLARAGHHVRLYEMLDDVLLSASGINQYRLHRGYHYPRSGETVKAILQAEKSFKSEYGSAVFGDGDPHVYAIASKESLTSARDYIKFCDTHELEYSVLRDYSYLNYDVIDLALLVREQWFDIDTLRVLVKEKLREAKVEICFRTKPKMNDLDTFDQVVIATYAQLNSISAPGAVSQTYQFELCEKPVVRMPNNFIRQGIVIMDGPFMCIDPFGKSELFVLGNVVHGIHHSNIGLIPEIPPHFADLINKGCISNPEYTNWDSFISSGAEYIPDLKYAQQVGSFFTVRTVLPKQESTDARPTIVRRLNEKYIQIFSGKISNCIDAADDVLTHVQSI